jgi:hypothetical protein
MGWEALIEGFFWIICFVRVALKRDATNRLEWGL